MPIPQTTKPFTTRNQKLEWMLAHQDRWDGYPWLDIKTEDQRRADLAAILVDFKLTCYSLNTQDAYIYMPNWIKAARAYGRVVGRRVG